MFSGSTFVFALIAVAGALMASNRIRYDIVALLVVVALMLSGVLTVGESLAGFGSPVVIVVAGLLIIGEMLARTGVASLVGDLILSRGGSSESRLLVLIMLGAALLGAVMSSTAVVAIFIPIIIRIASQTGLRSSRLLLPMSYAALISGMLTLIATTPNIVVHEELKAEGFEGFGFFGFTPIGVAVLAVAIVYMLFVGRFLLKGRETQDVAPVARSIFDVWKTYQSGEDYGRARIQPGSSLIGKTVEAADFDSNFGLRLVGVAPYGAPAELITSPSNSTMLAAGDVLLLIGPSDGLKRLIEDQGLLRLPRLLKEQKRWLWELGGASVIVHPESKLLGKTLREIDFHTRYRLHALGLRRGSEPLADYADIPLARGDSLFVLGPWARIRQLASMSRDFVVLETPKELDEVVPAHRKMPVALAILAGMVTLTIFDLVPLAGAVLIAVLAAIFTRCLTMEDAYRSIHWSNIVLIAGMLPLADALNATGGTEIIVDSLMSVAGEAGPYPMMTLLFFLTAALGLVLSNTASAVLVAPIAIYAASGLGVSPYPFAVAVLIAASAAYSTPVSTPVVTLVVDPGRYRFVDFLKLGVPLLFLTYLVTLIVAPLVFPF